MKCLSTTTELELEQTRTILDAASATVLEAMAKLSDECARREKAEHDRDVAEAKLQAAQEEIERAWTDTEIAKGERDSALAQVQMLREALTGIRRAIERDLPYRAPEQFAELFKLIWRDADAALAQTEKT